MLSRIRESVWRTLLPLPASIHLDNETLTTTVELLIESPVLSSIYIFDENLKELWEAFTSDYKLVEAAGGVVQKGDRLLFIFKNKHWDLPKGKMEKGESQQDCAVREVKEECGISELDISDPIETIYHVYKEGEKLFLKKTYWFNMSTSEEGPFQGDSKEGITEVRWMNAREWDDAKLKSYPSLIQLLSSIF